VVTQLEYLLGEVAAGRAGRAPVEDADFLRRSWL
jgi:hypothetical protein